MCHLLAVGLSPVGCLTARADGGSAEKNLWGSSRSPSVRRGLEGRASCRERERGCRWAGGRVQHVAEDEAGGSTSRLSSRRRRLEAGVEIGSQDWDRRVWPRTQKSASGCAWRSLEHWTLRIRAYDERMAATVRDVFSVWTVQSALSRFHREAPRRMWPPASSANRPRHKPATAFVPA